MHTRVCQCRKLEGESGGWLTVVLHTYTRVPVGPCKLDHPLSLPACQRTGGFQASEDNHVAKY